MNKKKGIIIGAFALILTMVVGYALFGKNIEIKGTATAEGDFSLAATCESGINSKFTSLLETSEYFPKEGGYENDSCSVEGTTVSFHSDLKYPGAARYFTTKITNTGTIDAKLDALKGAQLKKRKTCVDGINGELNGTIEDSECAEYDSLNSSYIYTIVEPVAFEKADGTIVTHLDEDVSYFMDENNNIFLRPGESLYLAMFIEFQLYYGNNSSGAFLVTNETQLDLAFTQKSN